MNQVTGGKLPSLEDDPQKLSGRFLFLVHSCNDSLLLSLFFFLLDSHSVAWHTLSGFCSMKVYDER